MPNCNFLKNILKKVDPTYNWVVLFRISTGLYPVKSTYKMIQKMNVNGDIYGNSGFWRDMSNLNIPLKAKKYVMDNDFSLSSYSCSTRFKTHIYSFLMSHVSSYNTDYLTLFCWLLLCCELLESIWFISGGYWGVFIWELAWRKI